MLNHKVILITGGSSFLGRRFTETIINQYKPAKLIIFSNDELGQYEMRQMVDQVNHPYVRYFIGDVCGRCAPPGS